MYRYGVIRQLGGLAFLGVVTACGAAPAPATPCPSVPAVATAAPAAPIAISSDETTRQLIAKIDAGDAKGVFAMFDDDMQKFLPVEKLQPFLAGVVADKGKLGAFQKKEEAGGVAKYVVTAERGQWTLVVAMKQGRIGGLRINAVVPEPPVVQSTLAIGLPFKGEWLVVWGGDTPELNHHIANPSQRRALDLLKVDADGKTFKNDGKALGDYFAYGQDVLAAADGTVVGVIDGVPDSVPGQLNPYSAIGNGVVVEHAGKVHSVYAHLIPNKIRVKVGSKVHRGDVVGQCGNSGNSSEPHLHFQLQDGPRFESSWGIEAVFGDVRLAGVPTKSHVLVKNDKLSP